MKGIIIYGNPSWGDNAGATYCDFINEASVDLKYIAVGEFENCLKGEVTETSKAVCSKDDTYDFETGALIALMKMCGLEKSAKAYAEIFDDTAYGDALIERDNLKEKVKALKLSNESLKKDNESFRKTAEVFRKTCEKLREENQRLKNTRDLLISKNNELIEKKKDLKKRLNAMYGYVDTDNVKPELPRTLDINGVTYRKGVSLKDLSMAFKIDHGNMITGWDPVKDFAEQMDNALSKPPTKRDEMWEKIFKIHKKSNVIIVVKKEDVITFLKEIEKRIPEITWASGNKIFEAKGTIGDIYGALTTCDRICFRLRKDNKLSYSSDPNTYLYTDFEHITYLPPMRWDLFEKGRLAVKVTYDNYKEFYEACECVIGKMPTSMYVGEFTVSICKDDGNFEIFTIEDQKKTGRKIVDWKNVR